jgi:hypothetical protein
MSLDLDTLANAAESEGVNFENLWPHLDVARQRLDALRTHKTGRGLSKENREELESAVNAYHAVLLNPLAILGATPDLHKDEFKFQAILVARDYLLFCIDVTPKKDDAEKLQFLHMLEERLIQPIREQPHLWGKWFAQLTDAAKPWERLRDTTTAATTRQPPPPAGRDVKLYESEPYRERVPAPSSSTTRPNMRIAPAPPYQNAPPSQNLPPQYGYPPQYYRTQYGGYPYAARSTNDPFSRDPVAIHNYNHLPPHGYYERYPQSSRDPFSGQFHDPSAFNSSTYESTYLPTPPREQRPHPIPPTESRPGEVHRLTAHEPQRPTTPSRPTSQPRPNTPPRPKGMLDLMARPRPTTPPVFEGDNSTLIQLSPKELAPIQT